MKVKFLTILFFIFAVVFFMNHVCAAGEGSNNTLNSSGVALSPPYVDFGRIGESTKSFTATIRNNIADADMEAKIENRGNDHITVSPNQFFLKKYETKKITITLKNDANLEIGPYDLSIYFVVTPKANTSIDANSTNSLRLVFIKQGLSVVSCNVGDISAVQVKPFTIIMGNFTDAYQEMDTVITIRSKKTEAIIDSYHYKVPMHPYPIMKYYGTVKLPLPTKPWDFGDYVFRMTAKDKSGNTLTYEKAFNVGIMKGELTRVETKNVHKGEQAEFKAVVKNIGNQSLPVTVKITVRDQADHIVYEQEQTDALSKETTKAFLFHWPTKFLAPGKYSIAYTVTMGNEEKQGILNFEIFPVSVFIIVIIVCSGIAILISVLFLCFLIRRCRKEKCNCHNSNC
ncbi:MAG: hypothetical protein BGN88_01520 [Clostridiales bacterium 43-6]|nr:MAG: hypothetical protein BGN88_01520 [Clostridiales bacterium 43-6]